MIRLDIGVVTGGNFGSSPELAYLPDLLQLNSNNYSDYYKSKYIRTDVSCVYNKLILILRTYIRNGVNIEKSMNTISNNVGMSYRNNEQKINNSTLGDVVVHATYDPNSKPFKLLFSDTKDMNYNDEYIKSTFNIININIYHLEKAIKEYGIETSIHRIVTDELLIPIRNIQTDYAVFNLLTDLDNPIPSVGVDQPFFIENINKGLSRYIGNLKGKVTNRNLLPPDILANCPTLTELDYEVVDDMYINNLIWLNLLSFKMVLGKCGNITNRGLYKKYYNKYKLYEPRGRGDKYFASCSSELLDKLEEIHFI